MPLEVMVRRLRSNPSEENVAKIHWLERILEKEIEKESKSLEQLVTGFGRFAKDDRARDLREWVARVVRSGDKEYYRGAPEREALETSDGRMTELGVAVLNSVLKQFLENAYSLGNGSDDSSQNTVKVPGYLVLDSDAHASDKGAERGKNLDSMTPNKVLLGPKSALDRSPLMSPKGRQHVNCTNDVFHPKEEGRDISLLPWKNLVKPKTDPKEKVWKSQPRVPSSEDKGKPNHTPMFPKFNFRQKVNHAINSIRMMNDWKNVVSNRVENSMGGVMHKYRSGESPPRNRLGRQSERIKRRDVSDKDHEGIKIELKELLNTITNRSGVQEKMEEEDWSDEGTNQPRVAFALPKNLLMDSTTPGSQIKVSRFHCHKFLPSCAKYASMHRKHHGHKNPTSELVNFLLMLHSNDTKSAPKGATTEPDDEYGCYDDEEAYDDDDDEDDEEDDGVDFGNPFQELKLTTTTRSPTGSSVMPAQNLTTTTCSPTVGSVTPAPWMQLITCTSQSTTRATSNTCSTTPSTCPTPGTTSTTCQAPLTRRTDPTPNPAQLSSLECKKYYQAIMATKEVTEKKNFFGELRLVTKASSPSSWIETVAPKKNSENATRAGVEVSGSTVKICSCHLGATLESTTMTTSVTTMETAANVSTSVTNTSVPAPNCESHTGSDAAATNSVTSSTTMQPSIRVVTYPCPTTTCEPVRTTLPPIPQHHEVLSMAPQPPPSNLPPCGVTGAVRNGNMNHSDKETRSSPNKKRASSRRNGVHGKSRRRHKIKHEPPNLPYTRRRYQRRQKPKLRPMKSDDQTGLLAILADPSMPGAMKNGLWRYVPYRMVHLPDAEKPSEINRGMNLDRVHPYREQPNLVRPLRKRPLQRLILRDGPKYRRRYQETDRGSKDDHDYDYEDYGSYENYENGP